MEPSQEIIENGEKRSLRDFAEKAIAYLNEHPGDNEVVQQAENILELEKDSRTSPETIHELPDGFQYYFSGFYGQVIGVGRIGIIH